MFGGFGPLGPSLNFSRAYKCYSMLMNSNEKAQKYNYGGKIYLPQSALQMLMNNPNIDYPMMFKLSNNNKNTSTHAGVLEFTAPEGQCFLPFWMMGLLKLKEGEVITIEYKKLQKASFAKFKPQSMGFIEDITDHRAVLERHLRDYSCLTKGDMIALHYLNKDYKIEVVDTKPSDAVSIIDTDMNVDFDTPVGYTEPKRPEQSSSIPIPKSTSLQNRKILEHQMAGSPLGTPEIRSKIEHHLINQSKDAAYNEFTGQAYRLDGKRRGTKAKSNAVQADFSKYVRGIPNTEWEVGTINFIRATKSSSKDEKEKVFKAFEGESQRLSHKRR